MLVQAALLRKPNEPFEIVELELEAPRPNEVLVRITVAGICQTDLHWASGGRDVPLPIVLGHEASGIVQAVGSEVTRVAVGDAVVITFGSCGHCQACASAHPAYCRSGPAMNLSGTRADGTSAYSLNGAPVFGHFVGVSAFATHTVVHERSVVKATSAVPFDVLAPMGCGFQTGAGTVLNVLPPPREGTLAVFGVGAVGLSAIMAGREVGWSHIVAVDQTDRRLAFAAMLAAETINTSSVADLARELRRSAGDAGVTCVVDTTGSPALAEIAWSALAPLGHLELVGAGRTGQVVSLSAASMLGGRRCSGNIEGDSNPEKFLPILMDLYARGALPVDELITPFLGLPSINEACDALRAGEVVKAVVRL